MKAIKLNTDEILNGSGKDYNPSEWVRIVNRFASYENCKFYLIPANEVYIYDRYYASYTTNEGLNLFSSVSYSSSLTNGGFYVCNILEGFTIENGEILKIEDNEVFISISKMLGRNTETGNYDSFVIANTKDAHKMMKEKSKQGLIFTKESI